MQPPEDPTPAAAPPKRPHPRAPAGAAAAVPLLPPFLMHHQIKPLTSLTSAEAADLGSLAAERGEGVENANPFAPSTPLHIAFREGFDQRAEELAVVA